MASPTATSSISQWPHWSTQIRGEHPTSDLDKLEIWGYTGKPSYTPGETLTLHVSTTARTFSVVIFRDGASVEVVHEVTDCPGAWHPTREDAFERGCGWPVSVEVPIPSAWRTGGYVIEFTATDERGSVTQDGFFVMRPEVPGRDGNLAVILPTYTWQEYNDWGGGCGYSRDVPPVDDDANPVERPTDQATAQRSLSGFCPRLSFDRPWARGLVRLPLGAPRYLVKDPPPIGWAVRYEQGEWALANGYSFWCGMAGWARHDGLFIRWAERQGYHPEMLTQWDLDRTPGLLEAYDCVVTVGHDEYWTAAGRAQLDDFITRGGRYARFAGNIFWQIRVEDDGATQVCYKYGAEDDPLRDADDPGLRTGGFESQAIADPPVTTFGANGGRGAYARLGGSSPRGVGGFVVYRNDHWAFDGTDLYYGDVLGASVPLVAYEVDGVDYTFRHGLPYPTGDDGAPADLEILGLTPATLHAEDHGAWGSVLLVGDGDLAFLTKAVFGADTEENRARIRFGSAVITSMRKGAGEVFCGGTTEWPFALSQGEPMVERIVRNVLDRFTGTGRWDDEAMASAQTER